MTDSNKLIDHLFRHEFGKIVSVISRLLGFKDLDTAEDIVQETMAKATKFWSFHGIPENPTAWLYTTAKNKAIDIIRKKKNFQKIESEYKELLSSEYSISYTVNEIFQEHEIEDSQLRMIFACTHPELREEQQICLILKTIGGFSAKEISRALLTSEDTINKRIYRAKEKIRKNNIKLELPVGINLKNRINTVNKIIYLLFNEGYFSDTNEEVIRKDLCFDAMRLCKLITDNKKVANYDSFALTALMCFNSARFDARLGEDGELISLRDQDRKKWNRELIYQGFKNFQTIDQNYRSSFVIEAAIALNHIAADTYEKTNWQNIINLYEILYHYNPTDQIKLNHSIALIENGNLDQAKKQLLELAPKTRHLNCTLSYLYLKLSDLENAEKYKKIALKEAKTETEKKHLEKFLII